MKKYLTKILIFVFALGQLTACSTHRARINYKDFRGEGVALKSGDVKGEDLGMVHGEDGGAIWDDCTLKARGSVADMIDNAKARGANAIGNIKWAATDTSEPNCEKSWGYMVMPIFILTPLFLSTRVDGTAYKVSKMGENMIPLPNNAEEREALIIALVGQ